MLIMQKTVLICLSFLVLASTNLFGQKPKIGLTYSSLGVNEVFTFLSLDGAPSYENDGYFALGINFLKPLNHWLEFETGLEYSKHHLIVHSHLPYDTDKIYIPREESFELVNIPVTLKVNFLKYFFVNGGLLIDIDASKSHYIHNQSGIGSLWGLGLKYDFKSGLSVFANPYAKVHSLIPFSAGNNHKRVFEGGFRFGLTYQLGIE